LVNNVGVEEPFTVSGIENGNNDEAQDMDSILTTRETQGTNTNVRQRADAPDVAVPPTVSRLAAREESGHSLGAISSR
jgi:hypothetical protein